MKRRIVAIVLVLAMVLTIVPAAVLALGADAEEADNYSFIALWPSEDNVDMKLIYDGESGNVDAVDGIAFDSSTSTLSISNVNLSAYSLYMNNMNTVNIVIDGYNTLNSITVSDGNLNIGGSGILTLDCRYYFGVPLALYETNAAVRPTLNVEEAVSLKLYPYNTDGEEIVMMTESYDPSDLSALFNIEPEVTTDFDVLQARDDSTGTTIYNNYVYADSLVTAGKTPYDEAYYDKSAGVTLRQSTDGNWYTYKNGSRINFIGLVENEYGWWRVENGKVNFNANGVYQNEYGWWKCESGKVNFSANTVAGNSYGWWKITDGHVDFSYWGIAQNEYGWWRIEGGAVNFNANGVYENEYGWWKVTNGQVDFSFRGLAANDYGWWYLRDGKVDFGYNGRATNEYGTWKVVNGKVVF